MGRRCIMEVVRSSSSPHAITERLPATARTALSMLFATGQAGWHENF